MADTDLVVFHLFKSDLEALVTSRVLTGDSEPHLKLAYGKIFEAWRDYEIGQAGWDPGVGFTDPELKALRGALTLKYDGIADLKIKEPVLWRVIGYLMRDWMPGDRTTLAT